MTRTAVNVGTVVALALAGCGDGDSAEEATEAAPAPTATATSAPAEQTDAEQTEAAQPRERSYRVRRGDTLTEIAERFDTTVRALVRLNDIDDPHEIRAGEQLRIPVDE